MSNNIEWADIDDPFPPGLYHRPGLQAVDPEHPLLEYEWDAALGLGNVVIYTEGPDALTRLADWLSLRADGLRAIAARRRTTDQ